MKVLKKHLTARLVALFLGLALVPLMMASSLAVRAVNETANKQTGALRSSAQTVMSRVERNLFERYGDVQAFGLNEVLLKRDDWYVEGEKSQLVQTINQYMSTYTPIYEVMLLVDTKGRTIAVNSVTWDGKPAPTAELYKGKFDSEPWFQSVMRGEFTEGDGISGTYVQDAAVDSQMKSLFGGDGVYITYTAPFKDEKGRVIGIWRNYARLALVQSIVDEAVKELGGSGLTTSHVAVVNAQGKPLSTGNKEGETTAPLAESAAFTQFAPVSAALKSASGIVPGQWKSQPGHRLAGRGVGERRGDFCFGPANRSNSHHCRARCGGCHRLHCLAGGPGHHPSGGGNGGGTARREHGRPGRGDCSPVGR